MCWLHYSSQSLAGWHFCPWGILLDYSSSACAAALRGLKSARTNAGDVPALGTHQRILKQQHLAETETLLIKQATKICV